MSTFGRGGDGGSARRPNGAEGKVDVVDLLHLELGLVRVFTHRPTRQHLHEVDQQHTIGEILVQIIDVEVSLLQVVVGPVLEGLCAQ